MINLLPQPIKIRDQSWPQATIPIVSVCCWAYNDAKYVRECIESLLMQETSFPVEIVIQDDASVDGTQQIIAEYEVRYPGLFRNILHKTNQHSIGGNITCSLLSSPRGLYVALCHADDYWTRHDKIEIQANYLAAHPECSGVFHRGYAVNESGERIPFVWDQCEYQQEYKQEDCIFNFKSGYPTAALMFRSAAYPKTLPSYFQEASTDYCLDIVLTDFGPLGFQDFEGSAYRQHPGGIWSTLTPKAQQASMVRRLIAIYGDADLRKKYPAIKRLLQQQLDEVWGQAYQGTLRSWLTATVFCCRLGVRAGLPWLLEWLLRPASPARYQLRDLLFRRRSFGA
jgi:glycosyltransferase involved in cell wall biosynthesis